MFDENRVENNLIDKIKPTEKLIRKLAIKKKSARSQLPTAIVGAFADKNKLFIYFTSSNKNLGMAYSDNAVDFQLSDVLLPKKNQQHSVVINTFENNSYLMFVGGQSIKMATSKNCQDWQFDPNPLENIITSHDEIIEVDLAKELKNGILLCYRIVQKEGKNFRQTVHLALLDSYNPKIMHWLSLSPVWESLPEWGETSFGGTAVFRSQIYTFWNTSKLGMIVVRLPIEGIIPFELPKDHVISLEKSRSNPVIYPRSEFFWESFATYNPAAFVAEGKIHILYRAQGHDLISSIGYASSQDGINIDERLSNPVYLPQEVFESYQMVSPLDVEEKYVSGGGIAGCEDPRVTLIDDRVYMTYVAFDGANPPRVALTSIILRDFLAQNWLWQKPVLISPPGIVDKSAVIFPEKINNKYVIMHRVFPDILIDYESDLNFDGTRWLKGEHRISVRENMWDSRKIGAGAPPIKTSEGWLLIYYGVDDRDDRFYKMGAMLLDLLDPTKVLYRSSTPILEPEDWYENSGFKPGIVYPCGAVLLNEKLLVYYGGADCVVCVASKNLNDFIFSLKSNHELKLTKQSALKIGDHETHTMQFKSAYHS